MHLPPPERSHRHLFHHQWLNATIKSISAFYHKKFVYPEIPPQSLPREIIPPPLPHPRAPPSPWEEQFMPKILHKIGIFWKSPATILSNMSNLCSVILFSRPAPGH